MKSDWAPNSALSGLSRVGLWDSCSTKCKICLFLIPSMAIPWFQHWPWVGSIWLVALSLLSTTRPNWFWWAVRFLPLAGSVAFFAFWLPWTVAGDFLWPDAWYSPTKEGLHRGLLLWLKGTGLAMGFLGLCRAATANEIFFTFQSVGFPVVPLCVIWITLQQTNRLLADWRRTMQAHRARSTPAMGNIEQTRFMARVWAQLLVRSQKRTEELTYALQARGFRRRFFILNKRTANPFTWIFPVGLVVLFGLVAIWELGWL